MDNALPEFRRSSHRAGIFRRFLQNQFASDALPEASQMLVLESDVPLVFGIRALDHYKRPFAAVFDRQSAKFVHLLDERSVVDFFVYLCHYHQDVQCIRLLEREIHLAEPGGGSRQTDAHKENFLMPDSEATDDTSGSDQLAPEMATQKLIQTPTAPLMSTPSLSTTYGLLDLGRSLIDVLISSPMPQPSVHGTQGLTFSMEEVPRCSKSLSPTRQPDQSRRTRDECLAEMGAATGQSVDKKLEPGPLRSRGRCCSEKGASRVTSPTCRYNAESNARAERLNKKKELEERIGGPETYSLHYWSTLRRSNAVFPFVTMRSSLMDALRLLVRSRAYRIIVWDESRSTPMSFLTRSALLCHTLNHVSKLCAS